MHDTPTDYLFRATTYKRQGQTQSGEQRGSSDYQQQEMVMPTTTLLNNYIIILQKNHQIDLDSSTNCLQLYIYFSDFLLSL